MNTGSLLKPSRYINFIRWTFFEIKNTLFNALKGCKSIHYSLEGEDILLSLNIKNKSGFYVDIGAHHPRYLSNTYLFYKKGWRGINIDAMPGSMILFNKQRHRDINLEIPISDIDDKIKYHVFKAKALNTFSSELKNEYIKNGHILEQTIVLTPQKLSDVLDKYLPKNVHINFISVDVEGYDLQVLKSNNWFKYRPDYIVVEDQKFDIESPEKSKIYKYLTGKHYKLLSKLYTSLIFVSKIS